MAPPAWIKLENMQAHGEIGPQLQPPLELPHHSQQKRDLIVLYGKGGMPSIPFIHGSSRWKVTYSFGPWVPCTANLSQLRGQMSRLRSPDRVNKEVLENTSWIKPFRLRDAIRYSYITDMRFVLALCAMIGLSVWWYNLNVPESVLLTPDALVSPDLKLLVKVARDTFVNHVCSSHPQVSSPCDCGEPLNNAARDLLPEPFFDPLNILPERKMSMLKAVSVYTASIILCIALAESISHNGVYQDLYSL